MADGKIYITISDTRGGGDGPGTTTPEEDKEKEKKNPLADYAKHSFFNMIESQAKKAVNASINNIGNFTGDYVMQQHVSDSMQILNTALSFGTAALAGFKATGSPVGALIAIGIAGVNMGVNTGLQLYAGYQQNARQNRDVAQLRARAGLNSTNNGNRGTEY